MLGKKINLSNSIYQQRGSGMGLNVNDGMLINNRPDGQTGIQQASQIRKTIRHAQKVAVYSEAIAIGNRIDSEDCCH